MNKKLSLSKLVLLTAVSVTIIAPQSVSAQDTMLQGTVNKEDWLKTSPAPSLTREDIQKKSDPFKDIQSETFDAPADAFQVQSPTAAPPPPSTAFQLNANDSGQFFDGKGMPGLEEQTPTSTPASDNAMQQMLQPPARPADPNDPDSSQQMKLLWDIWHQRVAEQIFLRFDGVAQKAFPNSRPLICQAAYTVTNSGQITNIRLLRTSPNILYNSSLLVVLKSMNGNPILQFPPGSRRQSVEKTGTFMRNTGNQGYKYTKGDTETIEQKQQRLIQQMMQQGG
ncbi:MAG: TonB C-terminal domain-containing protein [Cyanobacteria bacterium]|nr:TonB C-terminal domain-containing protein [Cyanobacteriota bacterium]